MFKIFGAQGTYPLIEQPPEVVIVDQHFATIAQEAFQPGCCIIGAIGGGERQLHLGGYGVRRQRFIVAQEAHNSPRQEAVQGVMIVEGEQRVPPLFTVG